jgi:hypothetical protein
VLHRVYGVVLTVAVFTKHGVSVGILLERGAVRGWLTRESGQVPARCDKPSCAVCNDNALVEAQELRRPYMVFVVTAPGAVSARIMIAKLETVSIDVVLRRAVAACDSREGVARLGRQLSLGLWSSGLDCGCSLSAGMCEYCLRVCTVSERRRFVCRNRFSGVYPEGGQHWFGGVTDAAETAGAAWLRLQPVCLQYKSICPIGNLQWYTGVTWPDN